MIRLLNISNLAVVDNLKVEFSSGLNVLSGETGSGKSIIIDALGILSGNRVTSDVIRTGTERAHVEAVFDISGNAPLLNLLTDSGITVDDDEIVIKREILHAGRGRIFINNQSATLSLLKQIQPHIIDIHGQGDQQSLLLPDNQSKIYDAFVGSTSLRLELEQKYDQILIAIQQLESAHRTEAERLQLQDILEYQINEIQRAGLTPNEDVLLEQERNILANAERLMALSNETYQILYEAEQSVLVLLNLVQKKVDDLSIVDSAFVSYREQITDVKYGLGDVADFLRSYSESVDASPERLRWVEDRLEELRRLKRKYGDSVEAILESLADLESRLNHLMENDVRTEDLLRQVRDTVMEGSKIANALSNVRLSKRLELEELIHSELAQVALEHSRFHVVATHPNLATLQERISRFSSDLSPKVTFNRFGQETIEFYFSANLGEDVRRLREVVSGGELSRLMLVLKSIIAPTQFPRTLIFDEIDTGIGGRVADAVGVRLKKLASTNQVLCVTHQAQIARYADTHFLVSKEIGKSRTTTLIQPLEHTGRVNELARMLAGSEITNTAKKHARELLKSQ